MVEVVIRGCRIVGISAAVPDAVHAAADLERDISAPVERLIKATGISQRRRAPLGMTASDMCFAAAEDLLGELGWDPASIDLLVFVTQTPDYRLPATACALQHRLGLSDCCAAFDVGLGCSGYVYGLWQIASLIAAGGAKRALLLVGDTISQHIDFADRSVSPLFGDAGTATALERGEGDDVFACVLGTDGSGAEDLIIKGGGSRYNSQVASDRLFMDGAAVFNFTMERVPITNQRTLALAGWSVDDVELALFHQANKMLIEQLARKSGLDPSKVPIGLGDFGNTSGASVPLMCAAQLGNALSSGASKALIAGFGVGLSFGAVATTLRDLVMPPLRLLHVPKGSQS